MQSWNRKTVFVAVPPATEEENCDQMESWIYRKEKSNFKPNRTAVYRGKETLFFIRTTATLLVKNLQICYNK